jgi:hypothetical protein
MLSGAASRGPGPGLLVQGMGTYALLVALAGAGAGAWVKYREAQLQGMRTSTSCVLEVGDYNRPLYKPSLKRKLFYLLLPMKNHINASSVEPPQVKQLMSDCKPLVTGGERWGEGVCAGGGGADAGQ